MLVPKILNLDSQGLPLIYGVQGPIGPDEPQGSAIAIEVKHDIDSKLRHSLKKAIAIVIENTKGGLGISCNGLYPGYGHLKYTKPMYTEEKNLVFRAEYEK